MEREVPKDNRTPTRELIGSQLNKLNEECALEISSSHESSSPRLAAAQKTVNKQFGCPSIVSADGTNYIKGHISNVPEITPGIASVQDMQQLAAGIARGLRLSSDDMLNLLTRKNAVNDELAALGPALDKAVTYLASTSLEQKGKDARAGLCGLAQAIEDDFGHPLPPGQIGEYVGKSVAMFLPIGQSKLLKAPEIESLGGAQKLEALSDSELGLMGLKRFEMPKLKLERDEVSFKATVPGYPDAFFRAKLISPGVIEATDLFRRGLPEGTGNVLLSEGLKAHNILPTKKLILSGIINEATILGYRAGVAPENTMAAKCASKALKSLGITPISYTYDLADGGLNIVIETKR